MESVVLSVNKGKAFSLRKTSAKITCGSDASLKMTNSWTIEALVYLYSYTVIGQDGTIAILTDNYYLCITSSGFARVYMYGVGGWYTSSTAIPLNKFTHVAATYNGVNVIIYYNGAAVLTTPATGNIVQNGAAGARNFSIGGEGVNRNADIIIDEVRLWNIARTQSEIDSNKFNTLTSGTGLVSRWSLDESTGNYQDSVGVNHGAPTGTYYRIGSTAPIEETARRKILSAKRSGKMIILDHNQNQNIKLQINNCWGVSFWAKKRGGNQWIFDCRSGGTAYAWSSDINANLYTNNVLVGTSSLTVGAWVMVYAEFRTIQTANMRIASRYTDTEFTGYDIEDIRIYNAVLTAEERASLQTDYNPSPSLDAKIINRYILNDLTGVKGGDSLVTTGRLTAATRMELPITEKRTIKNVEKGRALRTFGISTSYATFPFTNAALLSTTFTFELWFKWNGKASFKQGSNTNAHYIAMKKNGRTGGSFEAFGFQFTETTGDVHWVMSDSAGVQKTITGYSKIKKGIWCHLAGTLDGANSKLYVNGSFISSIAAPSTNYPVFDTTPLYLASSGSSFWNGFGDIELSEVRHWNVARTLEEIQSTMNTRIESNAPASLVLRLPFDDPTANSVMRSSVGNYGTGTIYSATRIGSTAPLTN